jgi:paraquat-inducible protein B
LSISLKLLGINVSAESIKSLLTGGIAFATPPTPGPPVAAGSVFPLYEKADEKWVKWATPLPGWDHSKTNEPIQK